MERPCSGSPSTPAHVVLLRQASGTQIPERLKLALDSLDPVLEDSFTTIHGVSESSESRDRVAVYCYRSRMPPIPNPLLRLGETHEALDAMERLGGATSPRLRPTSHLPLDADRLDGALRSRSDLAGVTSLVRGLALQPKQYLRLLHLFHTEALQLGPLTALWVRFCQRHFDPLEVGGARVCLADGIKVAKEGRKMPGVKKLHQESTNNSKPEWIEGHSFQALAQLVRSPDGRRHLRPAHRPHPRGRDRLRAEELRRTLLDRLVELFFEIAEEIPRRVLLVADAYYASGKVIRPLLDQGHHLVTRVRRQCRGLRGPFAPHLAAGREGPASTEGSEAPEPAAGRAGLRSRHPAPSMTRAMSRSTTRARDLLWRPAGQLVRFVFVRHPHRGELILMTTDLTLDPLDVIALYGYRFKIEVGFRQAVHVLGAYAYHFWLAKMPPRKRGSGNQDIRKRYKLKQMTT